MKMQSIPTKLVVQNLKSLRRIAYAPSAISAPKHRKVMTQISSYIVNYVVLESISNVTESITFLNSSGDVTCVKPLDWKFKNEYHAHSVEGKEEHSDHVECRTVIPTL